MKTIIKTNILLLLFSFGVYGQSSFFWQHISNADSLHLYSDSILRMPDGNRITKNIQVNALRKGDSILYAYALSLEAKSRFVNGELNQASALQNEALAIFQKHNDRNGLCAALISLALVDFEKGNVYQSIQKLKHSTQLSLKTNSPYYHALAEYHMGRINFLQDEFVLAKQHVLRSKAIVDSSKLSTGLKNAIAQQLALIALEGEQYNDAYNLLSGSAQSSLNHDYIYSLDLTWSKYWLAAENPKRAEEFAEKALLWANENHTSLLMVEAQVNLSQVYLLKQDTKKSVESALKANQLHNELPASNSLKLKVLHQLYISQLANADTARALTTMLKFKSIEDSLQNFDLGKFGMFTQTASDASQNISSAPDTAQVSTVAAPPKRVVIKGESREVIIALIIISILSFIAGLIICSLLIKRKHELKKLKTANKELAEKEAKTTEEKQKLEENNAELIELDKNKNKVFSILTHDIRQPINQIKSVLELLEMEDLNERDRIDIVQKLRESIDNSGGALENLLLWSKNQMTGINTKIVDVHLLPQVWQIESQVKSNLESKKLRLDIDIPDFFKVKADMSQLDICIRNLVNNAIKFSNRGGVITIDTLEEDGNKVIRVIDNGVGMSIDQVDKLKNMKGNFTTLGTMNEKGTGLGVLITREFMENQNGKLEIQSRKGEGSIFSLIFYSDGSPKKESKTVVENSGKKI